MSSNEEECVPGHMVGSREVVAISINASYIIPFWSVGASHLPEAWKWSITVIYTPILYPALLWHYGLFASLHIDSPLPASSEEKEEQHEKEQKVKQGNTQKLQLRSNSEKRQTVIVAIGRWSQLHKRQICFLDASIAALGAKHRRW